MAAIKTEIGAFCELVGGELLCCIKIYCEIISSLNY